MNIFENYIKKVVNEEHWKFGFKINVKDESTGKIVQHFIKANTVDEFINKLLSLEPSLDIKSQNVIRKNLHELEAKIMH